MGLYNPITLSLAGSSSNSVTNTQLSASSNFQTLAANANRKGLIISNQSTANLFIRFGGDSISTTDYNVKINPNGYYEVPVNWTGILGFISDATVGNVVFSEFT